MKIVLTTLIAFLDLIALCQLKTTGVLELNEQPDRINSSIYSLGKRGFLIQSKETDGDTGELTFYSAKMEKQVSIPFEAGRYFSHQGVFADADSIRFSFLFSSKSRWKIKTFNTETQTMTDSEYEMTEPYFVPEGCLSFKDKIVMEGLLHHRPCILMLDLQSGRQDLIELPELKSKGTILSMNPDHRNERLSVFYKISNSTKEGALNLVFLNADGTFSNVFKLNTHSDYAIWNANVAWFNDSTFVIGGAYGLSRFSYLSAGFYFSKWENYVQKSMTYHPFCEFGEYLSYLPQDHLKIVEAVRKYRTSHFVENMVAVHPVYATESGYRLIAEVYYPTTTYQNTEKTSRTLTITKEEIQIQKNQQTESVEVFEGYKYTHAAVLDLDETGNKITDYCFAIKLGMMSPVVKRYVSVNTASDGKMKMSFVQRKNGVFVQEIVENRIQSTFFDGISENIDGMGERTHNLHCVYWYDNNFLLYGLHSVKWTPEGLILDSGRTPSIFFVKKMTVPG